MHEPSDILEYLQKSVTLNSSKYTYDIHLTLAVEQNCEAARRGHTKI